MGQVLLQFQKNRKRGSHSPKASWLGALAALASCFPRRSRRRVEPAEMQQHDCSTSTQRLGVRFSERIRRTFRFRWLTKS